MGETGAKSPPLKGCHKMARPKFIEMLSVAELKKIIADRKSRVSELKKQRNKLVKQLRKLDAEIEKAGGSAGRRGGIRPRNEMSLADAIAEALKSGKPMRVGDIADAVTKAGYKSSSPKFNAIVNQTLIKDKRFEATERGVYKLK